MIPNPYDDRPASVRLIRLEGLMVTRYATRPRKMRVLRRGVQYPQFEKSVESNGWTLRAAIGSSHCCKSVPPSSSISFTSPITAFRNNPGVVRSSAGIPPSIMRLYRNIRVPLDSTRISRFHHWRPLLTGSRPRF